MTEPIITKQQLSGFFDKCATGLDNGDGVPLTELASILQTIALVTNDEVFLSLPQSVGAFASELMRFKTLISVPFLAEEQRNSCQTCVKEAVTEAKEALKLLQKELCQSGERDCKNILNAMSKFSKHGYLMYSLRNQFTAVPGRAMAEE